MTKKLDPTRWRTALVYGLGASGRAAVRMLRKVGTAVVGVDDRGGDELDLAGLEPGPGLDLRLGAGAPVVLPAGTDALVLSPGVPPDRPLVLDARQRGIPVVAEVELAFHHAIGPVLGVTGSNGKSTTTALTGALLQAAGQTVAVCGNIGRPFAEAVLEADGARRIYVVELSSFQLETLHDFHPRAAAYLNLAPDHLDRYPNLSAYAATKKSLLGRLETGDVAVLNRDDPQVAACPSRGRRRFFSRTGKVADGCHLAGDRVLEVGPEGEAELFERSDLLLTGEHNLENAMAAALLARALEVSPGSIRCGMASFRGLDHRMQKVAEVSGVAYYDDSKGTNPAATARSLEGLPDGGVHLILGGLSKGSDFRELAAPVRRKAARLYLIGRAAQELATVLGRLVPFEIAGTLERAIAAAAGRARPGETVLLSPACASFDQFRDFAHRGERFRHLVGELAAAGDAEVKSG